MASKFDKTVKELAGALSEQSKRKVTPYDTKAEVVRVDGDTAYVHIPGGVDETPVRMTTSVKRGDTVQVRIANKKAWLYGNYTSPPTDDTRAIAVQKTATQTAKDLASLNDSFVENSRVVNSDIEGLKARNSEIENSVVKNSEVIDSHIENFKVIDGVVQNLRATDAEIQGKLTAAEADIGTLKSSKADISYLTSNYIDADTINAGFAKADLANVNNAWVKNGVIKDAAITDAQIIGVGANKITAGTIDASKITVTNLNADNLTVGTINGARIGKDSISLDKLTEEVPTKTYLDEVEERLQGQIDGRIETFTGDTVPTLNNYPAVDWTDTTTRKNHVGDVYYVVNAQDEANGHTYRFTETNGTFSWVLIEDTQITKALQDIKTMQGDISGIKQFDTEISSWKTETDQGLESLRTRTTTLETDMGTKVSTTTFNNLKNTVDENSATITSLGERVDTKADGSTVTTLSNTVNTVRQKAESNESKITNLTKTVNDNETDIEKKYSDLVQDVNGFKTEVGETYAKTTDIPTKVSELENDSNFANAAAVADAKKAGTDAASALNNYKTTVTNTYATKTSLTQTKNSLEGMISGVEDTTKAYSDGLIEQEVTDRNAAIKATADSINLSVSKTYAKTTDIPTVPTKVSELENDSDFATKAQAQGYVNNFSSRFSVTPENISTEVTETKDGKTLATRINQNANTVKIKASKVEIDGAAIFNNTDFKTAADAEYANKDEAVAEEQYIYFQTGTNEYVSGTNEWVTYNGDCVTENTHKWSTKRPPYNTIYPKIWVAKQTKTVSGNVTCTVAVYDDTVSSLTPRSSAIDRTQRIYFQSNSATAPATPGTNITDWVSNNSGNPNVWTTKRMSYSRTYPYVWTCEQRRVSNGKIGYTEVLLDDTTTVIDGGHIITGTVDANALNAASINASKKLTIGSMTDETQQSVLNSELEDDILDAKKYADLYFTNIDTNTGVQIHSIEDQSTYLQLNPTGGLEFWKDSKRTSQYADDGMTLYNTSDGAEIFKAKTNATKKTVACYQTAVYTEFEVLYDPYSSASESHRTANVTISTKYPVASIASITYVIDYGIMGVETTSTTSATKTQTAASATITYNNKTTGTVAFATSGTNGIKVTITASTAVQYNWLAIRRLTVKYNTTSVDASFVRVGKHYKDYNGNLFEVGVGTASAKDNALAVDLMGNTRLKKNASLYFDGEDMSARIRGGTYNNVENMYYETPGYHSFYVGKNSDFRGIAYLTGGQAQFNVPITVGASGRKLLRRKTISVDNQTISAASYKAITANADYDSSYAYDPIGIVGFNLDQASSSGSGVTHCSLYECYVSGGQVHWGVTNHMEKTAAKVKVSATVLYIATDQGL